jgi:hypothetical protein
LKKLERSPPLIVKGRDLAVDTFIGFNETKGGCRLVSFKWAVLWRQRPAKHTRGRLPKFL